MGTPSGLAKVEVVVPVPQQDSRGVEEADSPGLLLGKRGAEFLIVVFPDARLPFVLLRRDLLLLGHLEQHPLACVIVSILGRLRLLVNPSSRSRLLPDIMPKAIRIRRAQVLRGPRERDMNVRVLMTVGGTGPRDAGCPSEHGITPRPSG